MKQFNFKGLDKKKQLLLSPFALAISACGGGSKVEITPSLSAVKRFDATGDDLIDMVTIGSYYRNSSDEPILYGLSHGHYGEQWENPERVAEVLQDVMSEFPKYADIHLQYAGIFASPNAASDAGVSVVLTFDKFIFESNDSQAAWHGYYPHNDENDFGVKQIGGDVYLNFSSGLWKATDQADFERIITETDVGKAAILNGMGLTIGLKFTDTETATRPSIANTEFAENSEDYTYSVSHIPYESLSDDVGNTLGSYDILGLMYLYGPATDVNLGDTVYDLSNVSKYTVISDSGGIDTISFETTDRDIYLILPTVKLTEEYTSLVDVAFGGGLIDLDTPQEIVIGLVGDIENITTGSGDDYIFTNSANNTVKTGSGDDQIILSEGFDVVFGGEGSDTFIANFAGGDIYFFAENTVIKDFEIGIDTLSVTDGSKGLVFSQNSDGYATYTNEDGVYVVLEGIEGNVLLISTELNIDNPIINSENINPTEPINNQDLIVASDGDKNPSGSNYYVKSHDVFPSEEYEVSDNLSNTIFDQSYAESYISGYRDITTAKELPADPLIRALLHDSNRGVESETHSYWKGTDASKTISYSFVDSDLLLLDETVYTSTYKRNLVYQNKILEFSPEQKIEIRKAISEAAKIIDLNFVEVVEENNQVGTLRFGQTTADASSGSAFAMSPANSNAAAGDMWFETEFFADHALTQGQSSRFYTLLHELGHALSLKHTFDEDEFNPTTLPENLEFTNFTMMSYTHPDWKWYSGVDPSIFTPSNTFMVYDIQALQYLYGPNMNYNSGNNIYSFDEETPFAMSLWDSGGEDLLDFSNFELGSEIDLNDGQYSTINYQGWEATEHLGIAFDAFIENVNGTKGQDTIIGNELSNELNGNRGDDTLYGGEGNDYFDFAVNGRSGNDTMYGGTGDDVFVLYGNDTVIEYEGEGNDAIFNEHHQTFELPDNVEKLVAFGDLDYNLSGNNLNNTLRGSSGNDILTGRAGADAYLVTQNMGHDTVTDFNLSEGDRWFTTLDKAELAISVNDQQIVISVDEASSLTLVLEGTIA